MTRTSLEPGPATTRQGLYAGLASGDLRTLPAAVARIHFSTVSSAASGEFVVERPGGFLGRLLGRVLRFPAAGDRVTVSLFIVRSEHEEVWLRVFGRQLLVSTQRAARGALVERFGPFEVVFELGVRDGVLCFDQHAARLALGRLGVSLPRAVAPRVHARVAGDDRATHVDVSISVPGLGTLLRYGGSLDELDRP